MCVKRLIGKKSHERWVVALFNGAAEDSPPCDLYYTRIKKNKW